MTVGHLIIMCLPEAARGTKKDKCYALPTENAPVSVLTQGRRDMTRNMQDVILVGFLAHGFGIAADYFYLRSLTAKKQIEVVFAYGLQLLYVIGILTWFIWVHVARYRHEGRVCSGEYIPGLDSHDVIDGYAIREGLVLKICALTVYCLFGAIFVAIVSLNIYFR